jgi:hypothetical protein
VHLHGAEIAIAKTAGQPLRKAAAIASQAPPWRRRYASAGTETMRPESVQYRAQIWTTFTARELLQRAN